MNTTKEKRGMRFKWIAVALGLALAVGVSNADMEFAGWGPRAGLRFGLRGPSGPKPRETREISLLTRAPGSTNPADAD